MILAEFSVDESEKIGSDLPDVKNTHKSSGIPFDFESTFLKDW